MLFDDHLCMKQLLFENAILILPRSFIGTPYKVMKLKEDLSLPISTWTMSSLNWEINLSVKCWTVYIDEPIEVWGTNDIEEEKE